jgi:phage terminase large subunit
VIEFPDAFQFLFEPARYKVAYGGRGGAKSWAFARALLILGAQRPLRVLCARETQMSIKDSVHKLLSDQVKALGLQGYYTVLKSTILGANGTEIFFAGLKQGIDNLKSVEGADVCWIEEAQTVTRNSWEKLIPTIRKNGSEIWISFNPDLQSDETYQRFVLHPPPGAVVRRVNYVDNPWFPEVLRLEAQHLKETDIDSYNHIWEGCPKSVLEGAIYAQQLRAADAEQRITRVPYDPTLPVHTFWDLGIADATSIWFAQVVGFEFHLVDFVEGTGKSIQDYLKLLQARPYIYGTDWLPHDARARELGSGKSIEELMRKAGRQVQIVPMLKIADGINIARTIFSQCWFDEAKCADGLQALRHYRFEKDEETGVLSTKPVHDQYSHAADAFRMFAVAIRPPAKEEKQEHRYDEEYSWMG